MSFGRCPGTRTGGLSRWTGPNWPRSSPKRSDVQYRLEQKAVDERIRQYVQKVGRQRAPWFAAGVREVTWCTEVFFEARLVKQFGKDRCWLAGDAAHQTGPVGAQSMNVGMLEAESLAKRLRQILRDGAPASLLQDYDRECQAEWRRLLGLAGGLKAGSQTMPWVAARQSRLLACLPGSGAELAPLAGQLGLAF